jgi:YesN/AraC family two-component response regulator
MNKPKLKIEDQPFYIHQIKRTFAYDMPMNHSHLSYELYYMLAGDRYYFIEDRTYHVQQGDMILIEPHQLHRTINATSESHERVLINFRYSFIEDMLAQLDYNPLPMFGAHRLLKLDIKEQSQVEAIMLKLLKERKQEETGFEGYTKLLLLELLLLLLRHTRQTATKQAEYPNSLHRKVSDIVKYINMQYDQPLSLTQLAGQFHMSPYYLSRIYKEVTGFTLVEYVNQVRIKEAQRLLLTTAHNVTAITEMVGFDSSTHFGRVFKAVAGISPLQYRKLNK